MKSKNMQNMFVTQNLCNNVNNNPLHPRSCLFPIQIIALRLQPSSRDVLRSISIAVSLRCICLLVPSLQNVSAPQAVEIIRECHWSNCLDAYTYYIYLFPVNILCILVSSLQNISAPPSVEIIREAIGQVPSSGIGFVRFLR